MVPPPSQDRSDLHIETRLLVVAEMLERAVAEVRRAMLDIRSNPPGDLTIQTPSVTIQGPPPPTVTSIPNPDDDSRSTDVQ